MRVPRFVAVAGAAVALSIGGATAAHAADYPPTTSRQHSQGSTVPTTTSPTTVSAPRPEGLPFTGGNDTPLVWVGIAAIATGAAAVGRSRRRPRAR